MAIAKELGAKRLITIALICLGLLHRQLDDGLALAQLTEALALAREIDDKYQMASALIHIGGIAKDEHNYLHAQALYEEGRALFQEIGADWDTADALSKLGHLVQAQGNFSGAGALFRESLARWRAIGTFQWGGVAGCLDGLAGVYALHHQFEAAAHLFGAADALREVLRSSPSPRSHTSAEDKHAGVRAGLGEAAFATAWTAGCALSAEEAVDYALALPVVSASSGSLLPPVIHPAGLTAREVEVLRLLAQRLTYPQIAERLIISHRTVNAHVISIYSKLDVHSRSAATRFAIDHGLV
jgi:DNA-binding CsgD family transcriptional regulator